jgi:hypothetical protein
MTFNFTFKTDEEYEVKRDSTTFFDYNIVRMIVQLEDGSTLDFPCHSQEDYENCSKRWEGRIIDVYEAEHYYEMMFEY